LSVFAGHVLHRVAGLSLPWCERIAGIGVRRKRCGRGKKNLLLAGHQPIGILHANGDGELTWRIQSYSRKAGRLRLALRVEKELVGGAFLPTNDEPATQACGIELTAAHVNVGSGRMEPEEIGKNKIDERSARQQNGKQKNSEEVGGEVCALPGGRLLAFRLHCLTE
jgi:hypothetical protein